jgi:hypothetical protein
MSEEKTEALFHVIVSSILLGAKKALEQYPDEDPREWMMKTFLTIIDVSLHLQEEYQELYLKVAAEAVNENFEGEQTVEFIKGGFNLN